MSGTFFGFPNASSAGTAQSAAGQGSVVGPLRATANKFMPHSFNGATLPHPDNDGKYFSLPVVNVTSQLIELRNASGSVIWSVGATAINSGAIHFATGYIDYSEGRFYVLAHDNQGSTTLTYLAYITLATGVVVNLATLPIAWYLTNLNISMARAAQGSGDLRVYMTTGSGSLVRHTLSATTGAITSTASLNFGYGAPPVVANFGTSVFGNHFVSADERVLVCIDNKAIHIYRGGGYGSVASTALFNTGSSYGGVLLMPNGAGISLICPSNYVLGIRHFSMANFLVWLHATADAIGLPA